MRLSCKAIIVYNSPNSYVTGNQWVVRAGDSNTLYFQVVDLDQGPATPIAGVPYSSYPLAGNTGLRYLVGLDLVAPATASIQVTFPSIDPTKSVVLAATQVTPADSSLWSVTIPSAAQPAGGNVMFAVTEGTNTRSFSVLNLIGVEFSNNDGSC